MRLIGFFIKLIFLLSFLISIAAGSLFVYSLHDTPIVAKLDPLTAQQIKKVKTIIKANNPSHFTAGDKRTSSISESELNLLLSHSLARFDDRLRANVKLFNNSLYLTSSLSLPSNPLGNYLNISTEIKNNNQKIKINSLDIGDIQVPVFVATFLLNIINNEISSYFVEYQDIMNSINDFRFQKGRASINYVWNPGVAHKIKNRLASQVISPDLRKKIIVYTKKLSTVARSISGKRSSLIKLLKPMFGYAVERSQNNDPVEENRALFITLGAHMLGKNIPLLLGNRNVEHVVTRNYYLHNRNDLSKHFLISSALTAIANPAVAQAIGLEKEIDDSSGGSGFSFADLAADRAGVALANMGLASNKQAHTLQQRLANINSQADFMPSIDSLKEGLQDIDFKTLYQNTNSAEYKTVIQVIDQRIDECAIYQ
jgi:hypothetical protein